MKITHMPEDGTNFIPYEIQGKNIDFNDGDLMFNVSKKERDYEVVVDICQDYTGSLVMGTTGGERYVAQVIIPEREYKEIEKENPDYNPDSEDLTDAGKGTGSPTITERVPLPFNMDRCELRLWEMEG